MRWYKKPQEKGIRHYSRVGILDCVVSDIPKVGIISSIHLNLHKQEDAPTLVCETCESVEAGKEYIKSIIKEMIVDMVAGNESGE